MNNMKLPEFSEILKQKNIKLWFLAENVRSAYNVGAMFRTADGTGMTGLILCGYTPTPENPKVVKTSLGAEKHVPWINEVDTILTIQQLKNLQIPVLILETIPNAKKVFEYKPPKWPIVICAGNEIEGISSELIKEADEFLSVPMNGHKNSLNVAEAVSITMYEFFRKTL